MNRVAELPDILSAARNIGRQVRIDFAAKVTQNRARVDYLVHVRLRQISPHISTEYIRTTRKAQSRPIIAMIRVRNESDVLADTMNHLSTFADGIVLFDDCSTDDTVEIAQQHPNVLAIVRNRRWQTTKRIWEETAHRNILYQTALRYRPEWVFYSDADERYLGDIRHELLEALPSDIEAVRVELFDAYLSPDDKQPFRRGDELLNFRSKFGPERRNILAAWRTSSDAAFILPDSREPQGIPEDNVSIRFACQHYGKAMSIEQWDATCKYYIENFPPIYQERWRPRLGKAIHFESDFGRPLYSWADVQSHAVDI